MSIMQSLEHQSKTDKTYFFTNFENEVQVVFNDISRMSDVGRVSVNIMKGSIYLKGDYFIPLKSSNCLQLKCKELLDKLKEISCVLSVEIDSNFNLVFCLDRNLVYKTALIEVSKYSHSYGMTDLNKSVLVITDIEKSKSFDNLRNTLLAEHIISILSANKIKVFYNECPSIANSSSTKLICSDNCSLESICQGLEKKLKTTEWKSDSQVDNSICLDANRYLVCNGLLDKYGKSIEGIIVAKDKALDDLQRTCYIKHLMDDHMHERPDFILHIASQGQNRSIYKSGILLGMLEDYHIIQVYIFNQSVQNKGNKSTTADAFIGEHKMEIENAMAHKYDSYNPNDKTWAGRIQSLTDTAVKFDYLKLNHGSILNLRSPSPSEKNFGVFAQYNFARLSNLFKNFDEKVEEGFYLPMSPLEDADFGLLKLEEEWNLFHYVLSFPKLVLGLVESLLPVEGAKLRYRLNRVCVMLQELCQQLSLYYSRIRILSGPQPHLQKTMNARLWLLKGIHQIFKSSFLLLNVEGLDQM